MEGNGELVYCNSWKTNFLGIIAMLEKFGNLKVCDNALSSQMTCC